VGACVLTSLTFPPRNGTKITLLLFVHRKDLEKVCHKIKGNRQRHSCRERCPPPHPAKTNIIEIRAMSRKFPPSLNEQQITLYSTKPSLRSYWAYSAKLSGSPVQYLIPSLFVSGGCFCWTEGPMDGRADRRKGQ